MKNTVLILCFFSLHFWLLGQTSINILSNKDAVIGFHDNYNSANNNYGNADFFGGFSQDGNAGGENAGQSLIYFDLSGLSNCVPIISASLDLFGRGAYGVGNAVSVGNIGQNECYLERITSYWDENTVTWSTQPTTTSLNRVLLSSSTNTIQDYLGIDVTQLIIDMVNNPASSHGLRIRLVTEDPTRSLAFCSTDYPDPSKYPVLRIIQSSVTNSTISQFNYEINRCSGEVKFINLSVGNQTNDWNFGDGSQSFETSPVHTYTAIGNYNISLITNKNNSCADTSYQSINIQTLNDPIIIPNVFTPNGDNNNDLLIIKGLNNCSKYSFKIHNRWGIKIFETEDILNKFWDGTTLSGIAVTEGTYFYMFDSGTTRLTGFITVFR